MKQFIRFIFVFAIFLQVRDARGQNDPAASPKLQDIAWSPDGTRIAGAYQNSQIAIWSVNDLIDPIVTIQVEADTVSWTPDSRQLIVQGTSATDDHLLRMSVTKWNASTGQKVDTLMSFQLDTGFDFNPYGYNIFPVMALDSTATKAAFSFRGGTVLISDGSQVLHLKNVNTTNAVLRMIWNPNGQQLAVIYGSSDIYNIQVFNTETDELILNIYQDLQYFVTDWGWDASGTYLATSSMRYTCCEGWSNIGIYKIEKGDDYIDTQFWRTNIERYAAPIAWHPSKYILAIATTDAIEVYDPSEKEPFFKVAVNEARDIEWSPDGMQIAGVTSDNTIKIWDVP